MKFEASKAAALNKLNNFFWRLVYKFFRKTIIKFLPINTASKNFITHNYKVDENKIKINPLGYEKFRKINKIEINK